jgi:hypothetical protein
MIIRVAVARADTALLQEFDKLSTGFLFQVGGKRNGLHPKALIVE